MKKKEYEATLSAPQLYMLMVNSSTNTIDCLASIMCSFRDVLVSRLNFQICGFRVHLIRCEARSIESPMDLIRTATSTADGDDILPVLRQLYETWSRGKSEEFLTDVILETDQVVASQHRRWVWPRI